MGALHPVGATQESDGSRSMRRVLALCFSIAGIGLFTISALRDSQWGFWSGFAAGGYSILLMGFTTVEEIVRLLKAAASIVRGASQDKPDATYRDSAALVEPGM